MNLNAEQLAVLVRTLKQDESDASLEKRRAIRACHPGTLSIILCEPPLDCPPADAQHSFNVRAQAAVRIADLSSRGIALIHSQPLQPGQRFLIQLPRQIDHHVHILCTVVHTEPCGQGLYNIGAEFTGVVPDENTGRPCNKRAAAYA